MNLEHNLQAQSCMSFSHSASCGYSSSATAAPSLTLRSNKQHGFHVHIARSRRDGSKLKDDARFVSIAESGSTCTFFNQEWAQLGGQITEVSSSIMAAEREAFEQLRAEVIAHSMIIRKNARVIDELDVTLGFADLADEAQWVRPTLTEEYDNFCFFSGYH
jgi:DNA mismatch repair ATPase MutS